MTTVSLAPLRNLYGWKAADYFKANTTYRGIPYTQSPNQLDEIGFKNSMSNTDFYNVYYDGRYIPRYGNDCSGFVSKAFNTYRHTTWTLESDSQLTKIYDLYQVKPGDAVCTNYSGYEHTFIINGVSGNTLYCYEQTPKFAQSTVHYISDLKNLGYFIVRNADWGGSIPYIVKPTN